MLFICDEGSEIKRFFLNQLILIGEGGKFNGLIFHVPDQCIHLLYSTTALSQKLRGKFLTTTHSLKSDQNVKYMMWTMHT